MARLPFPSIGGNLASFQRGPTGVAAANQAALQSITRGHQNVFASILQEIERRKAERAEKSAASKERKGQRLQAGIAVGGAALGGGIGALAAAPAAAAGTAGATAAPAAAAAIPGIGGSALTLPTVGTSAALTSGLLAGGATGGAAGGLAGEAVSGIPQAVDGTGGLAAQAPTPAPLSQLPAPPQVPSGLSRFFTGAGLGAAGALTGTNLAGPYINRIAGIPGQQRQHALDIAKLGQAGADIFATTALGRSRLADAGQTKAETVTEQELRGPRADEIQANATKRLAEAGAAEDLGTKLQAEAGQILALTPPKVEELESAAGANEALARARDASAALRGEKATTIRDLRPGKLDTQGFRQGLLEAQIGGVEAQTGLTTAKTGLTTARTGEIERGADRFAKPPKPFSPETFREESRKTFRALRALDPKDPNIQVVGDTLFRLARGKITAEELVELMNQMSAFGWVPPGGKALPGF